MKLQTYDELRQSKCKLSLMLFLCLNAVTSLFCLLPVDHHSASDLSVPCLLIILLSLIVPVSCLIRPWLNTRRLTIITFTAGLLWSWEIVHRYTQALYPDSSFLLLSLTAICFVSSISLSNHLSGFLLHVIPVATTILLLDRGQHLLLLLFILMLPVCGVTLQYLMHRRWDNFTHELVQQLFREKKTYSDLSMLDPLTGLYNRRGLQNRLLSIPEDLPGNHFVLLLDIDNFKAYNDNYGHSMGDQALTLVAFAIRDAVRSRDIVTRYGGEEFLVLLPHVDLATATERAHNIQKQVRDLKIPHRFNHQVSAHVTVSAGIAAMNNNNFDEAVKHADLALYVAKNRGRNTILIYEKLSKEQLAEHAMSLTKTT